ncbi:Sphingoid long-chain base transporter RSB1 [Fusarium oxysporum f. sp. albedinis]|nr:Sphingoid long-chain base transporter RSB1 [Fusarium oxysporum f. sp. albedinis]
MLPTNMNAMRCDNVNDKAKVKSKRLGCRELKRVWLAWASSFEGGERSLERNSKAGGRRLGIGFEAGWG